MFNRNIATLLIFTSLISASGCGSSDQGVMATDEEAKKAAEIAAQDVKDTENATKKQNGGRASRNED